MRMKGAKTMTHDPHEVQIKAGPNPYRFSNAAGRLFVILLVIGFVVSLVMTVFVIVENWGESSSSSYHEDPADRYRWRH